MKEPHIFHGHLHAPFFIFFRREPRLSDEQVLAHFGLPAHRLTPSVPPFSTYVVLADLGDWTMLADDWLYRLWHLPTTRPAIASLARSRDVFAWSIGECDESFEYYLYTGGELVRQYTVDSPHYNDRIIRIDFGRRPSFETEFFAGDLPIDRKLNQYCLNLGIDTRVTPDQLRIYSEPYQSRLTLEGAIHNF